MTYIPINEDKLIHINFIRYNTEKYDSLDTEAACGLVSIYGTIMDDLGNILETEYIKARGKELLDIIDNKKLLKDLDLLGMGHVSYLKIANGLLA